MPPRCGICQNVPGQPQRYPRNLRQKHAEATAMAEKKAQADIKADVEQQIFCHLAHMHTAKFLTFFNMPQ